MSKLDAITPSEAWRFGSTAFSEGKSLEDNPFKDHDAYKSDSWRNGWLCSKMYADRRKERDQG